MSVSSLGIWRRVIVVHGKTWHSQDFARPAIPIHFIKNEWGWVFFLVQNQRIYDPNSGPSLFMICRYQSTRVSKSLFSEGTSMADGNHLLLTVREVSKLLRIHRPKVYDLIKNNTIQGFKLGSDWRIKRDSVEALIGAIPEIFFEESDEDDKPELGKIGLRVMR